MTLDAQLLSLLHKTKLNKLLLTEGNKLDHVKLSRTVQFILVIIIVWLLSQLTWQLLTPAAKPNAPTVVVNSQTGSTSKASVARLVKMNLFGDFNAVVEEPVVKEVEVAPVTSLNLKLTGVVSSSDPSRAAAIIERSGTQTTYGVGEKIDGTQAVVREVYEDRIILEQRNKRETLMLEGADYTVQTSSATRTATPSRADRKSTAKRIDPKHAKLLEEQREAFLADPGKISDYIKAAPFKRNGQLVGYKIRPGKKAELFKAFGLRNGDIAIEINGYDLTDLSQAMLAMQELRSATEATLMVERNGEMVETHFSLN
ncbi:type II secretion system protein GspC [Saccharobesus litoralis]|uniref:Type II secretion system protein GspC n=1 Tax=Saccharobesus litoralis TaxID=2172099 RepID=A0A2S0VWZ2_9ALTE|nr:type II secretion system protein GspC [Saccharobesus litoralis]AWB68692.1 type II secretion system protein GspC [Saccharobesus litoralis]